jgi:hypothetical protein
MSVVNNHIFRRTCALLPLFFIGLYNTIIHRYTHTEQFTSVIIPYTFMCYLIWDMFSMMVIPILYRLDLMVHHIVCCVITTIQIVYYNMNERFNIALIGECISLLNYALRNNRTLLNNYRVLVIMLVRLPICVHDVYIYHSTNIYQLWMFLFLNIGILFILYDAFLIYRILGSTKFRCVTILPPARSYILIPRVGEFSATPTDVSSPGRL